MAVTLLPIGEHLSLEFDATDLDEIRHYLRTQYPDMASKLAGIATVIDFGGAEFTFENECDDPCLISNSTRGDELLLSIHAHFGSA